jgi:hypothetical protein
MLSGCAVLSFAPPQVRMDHEIVANNNEKFFNAVCTPDQNAVAKNTIEQNFAGAQRLINNFILTYRCQRDRAAEGRQFFDVPGMLIGTGAAAAAAFNAPTAVAIGAGATGVALKQGKDYWDPKAKAVVFDDALDAMLCIQNESVGIDPITLKALSEAEQGNEPPPKTTTTTTTTNNGQVVQVVSVDEGPGITVTSEAQYFTMIRTALYSVERVVAQRLSDAGKPFDTAGVVAELEKYTKKTEDAKTDAGTSK